MKVSVVKFGKVTSKEIMSLIGEYKKRLSSSLKVEYVELKANVSEPVTKATLDALRKSAGAHICILDERGENFSSPELATFISDKAQDPSVKTLLFVIGPPFGFSEDVLTQVDSTWSLSRAVFPNELATLLVWEQLYRAQSILSGSKYHHA